MITARTDIAVCIFSFLLVSWVVVSGAPAACVSFADAMGTPQLGQDGAESEISLLHSGQFIRAMKVTSYYFYRPTQFKEYRIELGMWSSPETHCAASIMLATVFSSAAR